MKHGIDCQKASHDPNKRGYEHAADYDGVYDVDGVPYCGRCHYWMGCEVRDEKDTR